MGFVDKYLAIPNQGHADSIILNNCSIIISSDMGSGELRSSSPTHLEW